MYAIYIADAKRTADAAELSNSLRMMEKTLLEALRNVSSMRPRVNILNHRIALLRVVVRRPPARKRQSSFLSFPYVCPEPVLAKRSVLCINGSKLPFFAYQISPKSGVVPSSATPSNGVAGRQPGASRDNALTSAVSITQSTDPSAADRSTVCACRNAFRFSFSCVCPKPVLVNLRGLVQSRPKKAFFRTGRSARPNASTKTEPSCGKRHLF